MNQILLLKEGECKFNLPLKLRKSFEVKQDEVGSKLNEQTPGYVEMPEQFKSLNLESGKYFWGYANVEQVDMQGDLFPIATLEELAPGLTESPYNKIFLFHNYEDIATGTIIATAVDQRGLLILAKLNEDHQRAPEVWSSILNGSLDGLSMGGSFVEVESYYDEEYDMTITVAKKATASEVSLTSIPVNGGSMLMGAFQKAKKKYIEKFGDPKMFLKGKQVPDLTKKKEGAEYQKPFAGYKNFKDCVSKNGDKSNPQAYCATIMRKVEKSSDGENFKNNDNYDKSMVDKKEMTDSEKKIYDKAISDGKTEGDALKLVMESQKKEAGKNVNKDLIGGKKKGKDMKKSVDDETETETEENSEEDNAGEPEGESESETETETEEKSDETDKTDNDADDETDDDAEKKDDESDSDEDKDADDDTDYKKAFEEMKEKNKELELKLEKFKKAVPTKPVRKSVKPDQDPVPASDSSNKKDSTPFLSWLKN